MRQATVGGIPAAVQSGNPGSGCVKVPVQRGLIRMKTWHAMSIDHGLAEIASSGDGETTPPHA
jgi:hypothetical protein